MTVLRLRPADGPAETPTTDEFEGAALRAREDPAAFAEVYIAHRDQVHRFLQARCASDDDALDLTAVTFERALGAMGQYSTRGGGIRAWLLRIARNAAVDHARRRRLRDLVWRAATDESAPLEDQPETAIVRADERRYLHSLLAELSDTERDAIALRYGSELTAREIGTVIGKSEEATQKLLSRALRRLKETYRDDR